MFSSILKTAVRAVLIPVAAAADVVTLPKRVIEGDGHVMPNTDANVKVVAGNVADVIDGMHK